MSRENALEVACPDCHRPEGQPCYGTHIPHRARYTKAAELVSIMGVERIIAGAEEHGAAEDLDMEVGDLQTMLREAWQHLTPQAREKVMAVWEDMLKEWT